MILKPQDLVIALKVFTLRNKKWNQRDLAQSLGMSLSEINGAIKRAIQSGLMIAGESRNHAPQSVPYSLQEFIIHGARYSYPIQKGPRTRGIPSGLVGAKLEATLAKGDDNDLPVWPSPQGKVRGVGIKPLFSSIPKIIEKHENRELYTLLSLIDMIREGRVREKNIATEAVAKILKSSSNHV
jgi:hypothetical protein